MIRVRYLTSFDRTYNRLKPTDQSHTAKAIERLLDYFAEGPKPIGLGLRKLRGTCWEIRASLDIRVMFLLDGDLATFVIAGNHAAVRRALRHPK